MKSLKWYEIHRSPEYRKKQRKIALEKEYGKWMKGKKMLPQTRDALLKASIGRNHWSFKGKDWRFWKTQALKRDNYVCQSCGHREPEIMEVDHILSKSLHPELQFVLENLMTMCPNCHRRKTIRDIKNKAIKFRGRKLTLLEA